jgi:hypothetical protein
LTLTADEAARRNLQGPERASRAGEAQTTGPLTDANHLTNNGGFNDLFEMGVASLWAHSRGSREPHLESEGCGDGRGEPLRLLKVVAE